MYCYVEFPEVDGLAIKIVYETKLQYLGQIQKAMGKHYTARKILNRFEYKIDGHK